MPRQRNTILTTVIAFLAVMLAVQLWLLVASQQAAAAGDAAVPLPSTLVSAVCCAGALALARRLPR